MPRYPHLTIPTPPDTQRFTSTSIGRSRFRSPQRERPQHARHLITSYTSATVGAGQRVQIGNGFYVRDDLTITFLSEPNFDLAFESLDLPASGIELLAVTKDDEGRTLATVRVPHDKVRIFLKRLEAYRDNDPSQQRAEGEQKKRDYRKLVESISDVRPATLRQLWTDPPEDFPAPGVPTTWEVWLRRPDAAHEADGLPESTLRRAAPDFGYVVVSNTLDFVDRSVVLVRGTLEQLSQSVDVLGIIAEVRKAKVAADFFLRQSVERQQELIDGLNGRVTLPPANAPVVALFDTGVNHGHPLLNRIITERDLYTHNPAWGVHDEWPHGTGMAGLAMFGDLTPLLTGDQAVTLRHRLQSHKLINRADPHAPQLYGAVTAEGVARLEIDPAPSRIYCMSITTDGKDRGRPTSWSAAVDNIAFGSNDNHRRLVILSAGNCREPANYPHANFTSSVQDPAQAWNALTVGGTTAKAIVDQEQNPGWEPLAPYGELSPTSTTSMTWPHSPRWPFKPDIVMEAGNIGAGPNNSRIQLEELLPLTTSDEFAVGQSPFITFSDTSAAAALAARLAADLWAQYPSFTPETIRALLVHSARWTPPMLARYTDGNGALHIINLLRTYGYGVPDEAAVFTSANNALTLIAQGSLRPFIKEEGSIKTCDLNLHALPWPVEALQALPPATQVNLRITLSYFIEPSPGERGWDKKYGYASHGLRFAVKRPLETVPEFTRRINAYDREEDYDTDVHQDEVGHWTLGTRMPPNGSIHSNIWTGTAAQLAARTHVAVYPTLGWWKTRPREGRVDNDVHYSLVVSITTPDETTDIYTPVAQQIGIAAPVEVAV